jgi:hypothetical protein
VAAQLAASQEGLSSMELVMYKDMVSGPDENIYTAATMFTVQRGRCLR